MCGECYLGKRTATGKSVCSCRRNVCGKDKMCERGESCKSVFAKCDIARNGNLAEIFRKNATVISRTLHTEDVSDICVFGGASANEGKCQLCEVCTTGKCAEADEFNAFVKYKGRE